MISMSREAEAFLDKSQQKYVCWPSPGMLSTHLLWSAGAMGSIFILWQTSGADRQLLWCAGSGGGQNANRPGNGLRQTATTMAALQSLQMTKPPACFKCLIHLGFHMFACADYQHAILQSSLDAVMDQSDVASQTKASEEASDPADAQLVQAPVKTPLLRSRGLTMYYHDSIHGIPQALVQDTARTHCLAETIVILTVRQVRLNGDFHCEGVIFKC